MELADAQAAPMQPLPTGTVSFLFTDIEGSTELLQRIGDDAYKAILEEHHSLVRDAFTAMGGREVDTQGDAFFVAFPDAAGAVKAAVNAQRAISEHQWPTGVTIRVRMGLHTGEPTIGPGGGGYVGIDVHRAARICSAGYGGQILLSDRTHVLAESLFQNGLGLRDLGEHRLKDLARPEHIFQVVIPGLTSEFPPLKSLDVRLTNLPSLELTSFIGREREVAELKELLSTSRLVTLLGPGGAGKTRLSLEVGGALLEAFSKGVWWVELAPVRDPTLVVQTVASVLGVREAPGRPLLETLLEFVRTRDLLIIIDNCEHIIEACADLAHALLRSAPKVKILTSSREPLGTPGEVLYHVRPLSLPAPSAATSRDDLMRFEATRLFIERAVVSNQGFNVTDTNAPAVAQICRRLDGIPLAIELAAARVRVLGVEQIAQRLATRFRLLKGGSRSGLPHHQTLRATVDWSYDLLHPEERALFRRLSVFAGGFTLEAAEAVCAGEHMAPEDVLDLVARLTDKSLLVAEATPSQDVRYRMLDTIREYSHERLVESGEAEAIQMTHLDWFLGVARQADTALQGPDQVQWLERLETEHDNFRATLEWSLRTDERGVAAFHLAGALWRFWGLRGFITEGRDWLEKCLARAHDVPGGLVAKVTYGAGHLAFQQGDYTKAEALARESLRLCGESGDDLGVALSLNLLGIILRNRGNYAQAQRVLDESLALSRNGRYSAVFAESLNILGVILRRQGNYETATDMFEHSLTLHREIGDPWGLARSLGHLGVVARQTGDYERARALHEESLALRRQLGDRWTIAAALNSLGLVAMHQEDHEHAHHLLKESLAISRELGDKANIVAVLCSLGLVDYYLGNDERAIASLNESVSLSRELGDRPNLAAALCNLGFLAFRQGDVERTAALYKDSLGLFVDLENWPGIADSLTGMARVAIVRGAAETAAEWLSAVEALRDDKHLPLSPLDRSDFSRALNEARAAVGPEAFDGAWSQGRATPREQVLQQALAFA